VCLASIAVALAHASPARAVSTFDDPYDLPEAPRAIALPELTHPDAEWTGISTVGGVVKTDSAGSTSTSPTFVQRMNLEVPIAARRWFAGASYGFAGGPSVESGAPARLISGNVELYGRTVWATRTGLAFGGGLGILPALAAFSRSGPAGELALAAASLQPTEYAFFHQGVFTVHPFVDVRDLVGRTVIQFRQSFDWSIEVSDLSRTHIYASSTLYLGYLVAPNVGAGIEASELYFVDDPVPDNRRAHFIVSPSVRFITQNVQPALSLFTSLGYPLYPESDTVWGLRFALTVIWDPRHRYSPEAEAR
jgi:hypothetical protein